MFRVILGQSRIKPLAVVGSAGLLKTFNTSRRVSRDKRGRQAFGATKHAPCSIRASKFEVNQCAWERKEKRRFGVG
jgi:hypothetical protein